MQNYTVCPLAKSPPTLSEETLKALIGKLQSLPNNPKAVSDCTKISITKILLTHRQKIAKEDAKILTEFL